jgi:hypothetical protein
VFARDTFRNTRPDTLYLTRADIGDLTLTGLIPLRQEIGFDLTIRLTADYEALFRGLNLTNADIPAWKTTLISNLTRTFSVSQ